MTPQDVKEQLAAIRKAAKESDDERAHSLEDDLHKAVLAAIASGTSHHIAMLLATEALKSTKIAFARWCA